MQSLISCLVFQSVKINKVKLNINVYMVCVWGQLDLFIYFFFFFEKEKNEYLFKNSRTMKKSC